MRSCGDAVSGFQWKLLFGSHVHFRWDKFMKTEDVPGRSVCKLQHLLVE